MAIDAIAQVAEAERQADEIMQNAAIKAKQLVADATRDGKKEMDQAIAEAEAHVRQMMQQAEDNAATATRDALAQAEAECKKLRVLAKGRMDKASSLIAEKVVKR